MPVDLERINALKLAKRASELQQGSVAVLPTDTNYTLACRLGDTQAISKIKRLRNLGDKHMLTLLLPSFQSLGKFAIVNNRYFRILKDLVPGPFSIILPATKAVPSAFCHKKRKTVGVRIPACEALRVFQEALGEPLVGCSLKTPGDDQPASRLADRRKWLSKVADLVVDCGELAGSQTTIVDMSGDEITLVRAGIGDPALLGLDAA